MVVLTTYSAINVYFRKQCIGGERLNDTVLWQQYIEGKQTLSAITSKYKCSIKTIQRRLDKITFTAPKVAANEVIVLIDTTYFGRCFGVMLVKDAYSEKICIRCMSKLKPTSSMPMALATC